MAETFWALVPAIMAIILALITKEVYLSLFVGIISGALFYTGFNILDTITTTFSLMGERIYGDGWNANILIFLVLLGIIVALLTKSGASRAYGKWAGGKIRNRKSAMLSTVGLGALIFVDDYFNCLTVGAVMGPIADKFKISRAKLAYLIDATAAPVCIIAPISSWAAAVSTQLPPDSTIDGFMLFIKAIPANYYALLTIMMVLFLAVTGFDFGPMAKAEKTYKAPTNKDVVTVKSDSKATIIDLILPIAALILFSVCSMLYTGGFFAGTDFITAFADCDASQSLVIGGFAALVFTFILYVPRKIVTYKEFTESISDGFKSMTSAILILVFAWTLSAICGEGYLNAGGFVEKLIGNSSIGLAVIPAVFFLVAMFQAFSTGTSWGTFAILLPIIFTVFGGVESNLMITAVASVLAGAVCGDHISPISDTTIMASTGAECNHIDHVSTQLPYAIPVAVVSFIGYIIAGFTANYILGLVISAALLLGFLFVMKMKA
ncbi:MAG: Na+/H+ antiporter NhaC family protein, partial [Clostridia bacterium]|nr:Na+/H+ antiporter NhaC family protein [Clostridia bacterium]